MKSLRFEITPEAEADAYEALNWHEAQSPGLGYHLLNIILDGYAYIERFPLTHQVVVPDADIRAKHLRPFPYTIYYQLVDDCSASWPCGTSTATPL